MPTLHLKQVKKGYPQPNGERIEVLDVPEYSLDKGEQTALIGASGGGKTTLLHIIAGITLADSGTVAIDGRDISRYSEPTRDRIRADKIGYVFQTFHLLPGFTALENVMLGMTFSRVKKDRHRAEDLLNRVGLGHRLSHRPKMMSVGEQQRVAVARALANRPAILLADEPTANVDPSNQQTIVDLIRNSCLEEKISLLMVTHSMEVANQFDRIDRLVDINQVVKAAQVTS